MFVSRISKLLPACGFQDLRHTDGKICHCQESSSLPKIVQFHICERKIAACNLGVPNQSRSSLDLEASRSRVLLSQTQNLPLALCLAGVLEVGKAGRVLFWELATPEIHLPENLTLEKKKGSEEVFHLTTGKTLTIPTVIKVREEVLSQQLKYTLLEDHSHQEGRDVADWLIQYVEEKEPGDARGWHSTSYHNERAVSGSLGEALMLFFFQSKVWILIIKGMHDVATPRNRYPYWFGHGIMSWKSLLSSRQM